MVRAIVDDEESGWSKCVVGRRRGALETRESLYQI